jgi:hypothetical protein
MPVTAAHVNPASVLINAPDPRVPANTRPDLNGLKATVRKAAGPLCANFQVEPPSALLISEPSAVPAMRT